MTAASTWLAANYHLPSTYSCRVPMSSTSSARALPTPGPATVRLALVRTAIELFGIPYTRNHLFPTIRAAPIRIRPPEHVAFSTHQIRAYKITGDTSTERDRIDEALVYREFAHASGPMTIFMSVQKRDVDVYGEILGSIGYWGQTNSLTYCTDIQVEAPPVNECAVALEELRLSIPIKALFSSVATEFRSSKVEWGEIMPVIGTAKSHALRMTIFVWPLILREQSKSGATYERCAVA